VAGANGAGKTTLLRVLQLVRSAYQAGVEDALRLVGASYLRRVGAPPSAPVHLELQVGDVHWTLDLPVEGMSIHPYYGEQLTRAGDVVLRAPMFGDKWFLGSQRRGRDEWRCGLRWLWDHDNPEWLSPLVELVRGVRVYESYWLNQVREVRDTGDRDSYLHGTGRNLWAVLQNWKGAPKKFRDQYAWVMNVMRQAFPDVVHELEFDVLGGVVQGRLYAPGATAAEEGIPTHLAADGVLTGFLHLTAVAGARDGSVVAFDEVENQLHPHAIRVILAAMRELAEERGLTIVLTTHSPVVMDEFKGHEDQFYVMESGRSPLPIPLNELRDPGWLANFSLGRLYERAGFAAPRPVGPIESADRD
jgi:energy-coupling factor transporter ATP-binding protein EcfA2